MKEITLKEAIVISLVIVLVLTFLIINVISYIKYNEIKHNILTLQQQIELDTINKKNIDNNYKFSINEYKNSKYENINIILNSQNKVGVAIYKYKKCFYALAGNKKVIVDNKLNKEACLEKINKISGRVVYLDPTNLNRKCNAENSISQTGIKSGCMKWYTFLEDESLPTINLILAHNTTATVAWNSQGGSEMKEASIALTNDTTNWEESIKNTARLITAEELAQIVGKTNFKDVKSYNQIDDVFKNMFWFENHKWDMSKLIDDIYPDYPKKGKARYDWLFNYTDSCTNYGCSIEEKTNLGYWTSTQFKVNKTSYAFFVANGMMAVDWDVTNNLYVGIRPVITVDKEMIK